MGLNKPKLEAVASDVNKASLKDILLNVRVTMHYLKSKWHWILLFAVAGGIAGFLYSKFAKVYYTAECTFVLEEESGAKSGGLSALGLGFGSKGGDFFTATDNIIWLYSTRLLLQKTLLTAIDTGGKKVMLIDWFIKESAEKDFAKYPAIRNDKFVYSPSDSILSRNQNAVIATCVYLIRSKYLKAELTPKTENVISVRFKSKDELFAQKFSEELVSNVNEYYIQTKTKKASDEVALLERKTAEYKGQMSSDIYEVAAGFDEAPYANPNRLVLKAKPQRKQVDAKISGEIYGGLVQQLELSRTNLQKQMPLIQIIEEPVLPLSAATLDPKLYSILGFILFAFLLIVIFIIKYHIKTLFA
jgi:hypothetical protein